MPPPILASMKYAFYVGTLTTYNSLMGSMKQDPTMAATVSLSEAIRADIEGYLMQFHMNGSGPMSH